MSSATSTMVNGIYTGSAVAAIRARTRRQVASPPRAPFRPSLETVSEIHAELARRADPEAIAGPRQRAHRFFIRQVRPCVEEVLGEQRHLGVVNIRPEPQIE